MKRTGSSIFAKRFLALLMVVVMLAAQLPTMAWADEGAPVAPPAEGEPAPQAETAGTDAGGTDTATVTPTPAPTVTPEAKDEGTTPAPETTPEAKDEGTKATPVPETTPEAKDEGTKATPETTPEAKGDDAKASATGGDETTTYTVTLDANGGTITADGFTFTDGKATVTTTDTAVLTLPTEAQVTKPTGAAAFAGWYAIDEAGKYVGDAVTTVSETNGSYKARWKYNVTYHYNDGTTDDSTTQELEGSTVTPTAVTDQDFRGWYTDVDFSTEAGTSVSVNANVDFYAKRVQMYTITFDTDGGKPIDPITLPEDTSWNLSMVTPEKEGHVLSKWQLIPAGKTEPALTIAAVAAFLVDAKYFGSDYTAKAVWDANAYTVNFEDKLNVKSYPVKAKFNEIIQTGTGDNQVPTDLTYEGMTFEGWYQSNDYKFTAGDTKIPGNDETVYYAKWTGEVKLELGGGEIAEGSSLTKYTYGKETKLPQNPPKISDGNPAIITKTGYTFTGWKNGTGEEAVTVEKIDANTIGKVTLYATWQLNSDNYTITAGSDTLTVTDGNTDWTNAETVTIKPKAPATGVIEGETDSAESYSVEAEGETSVSFKLTDGTNTPSETVDVNVRIDRTDPEVTFAYAGIGDGIVEKDENNVQMSSNGVTVTINVDEAHLPAGWNKDENVNVKLVNNSGKSEKDKTGAVTWSGTTGTVQISTADLAEDDEGTTYTLVVTGITDEAGNTCAVTKSDDLAYDGSEPAVTVTNLTKSLPEGRKYYNGFYNGDYQVKIEVTSSFLTKANIAKYVTVTLDSDNTKATTLEWSRDETNKKLWTATLDVTGAGKHTVSAKIDVAGQSRESDHATAYIDTTAPTGSITMDGSVVPETPVVAASHKVSASFADPALAESVSGSGVAEIHYYITASTGYDSVSLKVNGADYTLGADTAYNEELKITTDGRFEGTIYFYAVDNVENSGKDSENAAELVSAALSLDGKAPEVNVTSGSDGKVTNDTVAVTLTVTDDNIDLLAAPGEHDENTADIAVTMDKKAFNGYTATGWSFDEGQGAWTNTLTIEPDATDAHSKDGVYTVTLGATDSCGNITADENKKSVSFTIDTILPDAKIAFGDNKPTDGTTDAKKDKYYSHGEVSYTLTVTEKNFKSATITINGTPIDNTSDVAVEKQYTVSKWAHEEGSDDYTATVTILAPNDEKEYVIGLSAEDLAGNKSGTADELETKSGTLVIDTTDPVIKIDSPAPESKWISGYAGDEKYYLTGGEMDTITIHVKDENLVLVAAEGTKLLGAAVVSVFKKGETTPVTGDNIVVSPWESEGGNSWKCVVTFRESAEDGEYHITVQAADATRPTAEQLSEGSGYSKETSGDYVVDNTVPEVSFVSYQGNKEASMYYANVKGETTNTESVYAKYVNGADKLAVTIQIEDVNIDLKNPAVETNKADVVVKRGEDTLTIDSDYTESGWKYSETNECWENTLTITSEEEGVYTVSVTATDKASNKNADAPKVSDSLINDTTAPEIKATEGALKGYNGRDDNTNARDVYYTSSGTISNEFSVADDYLYTVTASIVKLGDTDTIAFSGATADVSTDKKTVTLSLNPANAEEGCYQVKIEAKDYAGNTTTYTSDYYIIDKTAPTGVIETEQFTPKWDQTFFGALEKFAFGLFAKDKIDLTFTGADETATKYNGVVTDGVAEVAYFIHSVSEKTGNDTKPTLAWLEARAWEKGDTKTVEKDAKFIAYARVTDKAGNVTYLSSDGMIVEDKAPVSGEDKTAPSITVTNKNSNSINVDVAYLTVNVLEKPDLIFSGIKGVEYGLTYTSTNGVVTHSEPGLSYDTKEAIDGLQGAGTQNVQLTVPEGFENDNVLFTVTATDNSGNTSPETNVTLNIDRRFPTAVIRYDNNEVYNNKYFNQPREATITVTELNFDENNTRVNTTGSRSGWTRSNETHSTATNTATVSYTTDGDYTLDFQTTDKAGHTLYDSGVTYDGAAPQEFTIDMTKPRATITFRDADGNEVPSGGYANSTVTATITIVEHNFDANSATNGIRITRDGETYRANVSWSTSGDTHTATIPFIEEEGALYTFDMSFVDLANNECDPFQRVSFYVDTMLPSITVSEIANNSANNAATIAPVVTVTDKYYDPNGVTVTLTGAKNGVVASAYSVSDVENGQQFTFENIEKDDIYTLTVKATDLAGNVNEEMFVEETGDTTDRVTFSVNREGSTYGVDEDTQALLKQYYTNKLDKDLKLTIINVDEIDPADLIVTVSLGLLDSRDLVEGEDYSIDMQPITGGYMYTVTIFKEVFDKDGAYTISVFTKDKAGNTSTNVTADDEHGMEMAFYLDTQAPTIVLNDLGKGKTYSVERYEDGSVSVSDQTLDEITVVLTYRTGEVATYVWDSEEIYSAEFNGTYLALLSGSRAIEQSKRSINIRVTAKDKAGNVAEGPYTETDGGIVVDEEYNFYVTTNPLTRFYANKGLFFGSIGGLVVLAAVVTGLVLSKKKKKATV